MCLMRDLLNKDIKQYSLVEYILLFLMIFSFIPGVSICGAGGLAFSYFIFFSLYWIVLVTLFNYCNGKVGGVHNKIHLLRYLFYAVCFISIATVLWTFVNYGTLYTSGITSNEIYTVRMQWCEKDIPIVVRYIMANSYNILCVLLIFLLEKKAYFSACLIVIIQYINFCCGANKVIVWGTCICLLIYSCKKIITIKSIMQALYSLIIIGFILLELNVSDIGVNFMRRMMFVPNILSFEYYDYIINSNGVIDGAVIPYEIGKIYYGNSNNNANTGLFGDAMRIYGLWGIILQPLLWCGYLCLLKLLSTNISYTTLMVIGILWANVMCESPIATSMLSHGGVALIVMLVCIPRVNRNLNQHL